MTTVHILKRSDGIKVSQCVPNCTVTVYFLKLHAPRLARDAGRIPVRKNYLVRKYRPKEVAHLVAHPVPPKAPRGPLTFPGRVQLHILPLGFGFAKPNFSDPPLGLGIFICVLKDQDSLMMAVKRSSLITFWEVSRS